ncbi:MAG: hypothetical protein NTW26_03555 [bacterium]|nr:hypothetical protein [bacterium]
MRRVPLVAALSLAFLASCGGKPAPQEEYTQDPRSTAAETPDVTEPLGLPAGDPSTAVEGFLLAAKLDQGEKLRKMLYPPGVGEVGAGLAEKLKNLDGAGITNWGDVTVGAERPVEGDVLESREVTARVHRGESSRVWRFTVVRTNAGWYVRDLED